MQTIATAPQAEAQAKRRSLAVKGLLTTLLARLTKPTSKDPKHDPTRRRTIAEVEVRGGRRRSSLKQAIRRLSGSRRALTAKEEETVEVKVPTPRKASVHETLMPASRRGSGGSSMTHTESTVSNEGNKWGSLKTLNGHRVEHAGEHHVNEETVADPVTPRGVMRRQWSGPMEALTESSASPLTTASELDISARKSTVTTNTNLDESAAAAYIAETQSTPLNAYATHSPGVETHEIMIGGEKRTATIDELTTLVAFGVVLPNMTDYRKIIEAQPSQQQQQSNGRRRSESLGSATPAQSSTPITAPNAAPAPIQFVYPHTYARPRRNSLPDSTQLPATPTRTHTSLPRSSSVSGKRVTFDQNAKPPAIKPTPHRPTTQFTPRRKSLGDTPIVDPNIARELPEFERQLKLRMTPAIFLKGEYIIRKGTVGKEMYFLSKGKVEVVSGDGKRQYSTIGQGSFFGELGVLFDIPRTASVRTVENSFCMVLTRTDLEDVLKSFPSISERFHRVVAQRMAVVRESREQSLRAEARLAAAFSTIEEEDEP